MTREAVLEVLCEAVMKVVPGLEPADFTPGVTLRELGANSIDRLDILLDVKESLGEDITVHDLTGARDLSGLATALHQRCGRPA
jgi:polyketide biosynthesis acyl carrier protein